MSDELIEKIQSLISAGMGDLGRLDHILKSIKEEKILFSSDQKYLDSLIEKYLTRESKVEVPLSSKEKKIETNQPEENLDKVQELQKRIKNLEEKVAKSDLKDSWKQQNYKSMAEDTSKKSSMLENQKLLAVVIIVAVIAFSAVFIMKYGDEYFGFDTPLGVGPINSEHAHGRLKVYIINDLVDFHPKNYPKYLFANDYISLDENKNIHRTAKGATVAHLLESMDITYTDECLVLNGDTYHGNGTMYEQKAYCNEGEMGMRFFVNKIFNEEGPNYVLQEGDKILVMYSKMDLDPF